MDSKSYPVTVKEEMKDMSRSTEDFGENSIDLDNCRSIAVDEGF